jgi:hypothetical protein
MRDLSIATQTLPPKQDAAITRGFFKTWNTKVKESIRDLNSFRK